MLEHSGSIPLYEQLKKILSYEILSGNYKQGDQLLNEDKLCSLYNVSRTTVRRSLKELENEGLVVINHGKGTFVNSQSINIKQIDIGGYTNTLSGTNHSINSIVLNKKVIFGDKEIAKIFNVDTSSKVLKLKRLIYDGQMPYSIDISYFPLSLYPGIAEKIEDNVSTFNILKYQYGVKLDKFYKEFGVISGNTQLSKILECSPFEPLYDIKKTMYDKNLKPIHFSNYYIIAKYVKYFFENK